MTLEVLSDTGKKNFHFSGPERRTLIYGNGDLIIQAWNFHESFGPLALIVEHSVGRVNG